MRLRSGLAPIGIAGLALIVGLWIALRSPAPSAVAPRPAEASDAGERDGTAELRAADASPTARDSAGEAHEPAPTAGGPEHAIALRVLSSSGLTLPHIDWRAAGGTWQRVELADDGVPRAPIRAPSEVRAPGHVAAELEPHRRELVLEPDVLFRVHAADLRACLREIDVHDPFLIASQYGTEADTRRPRVGVWGFVSDAEWAVAVSAAAVERELRRPELRVVTYRRDGIRTDAVLRVTPGLREDWWLPCDDTVPTAPLKITVVRPDGLDEGSLEIGVSRTGNTDHDSKREEHAWGLVYHYAAGTWGPKRELAAGEDEVEFEAVPLHLPHVVGVQDPANKAYGREFFIHDGSPRLVTLLPPLRVRGRLLDARDDTPLARAALVWQCRQGEERVTGWRAEDFDAELGADGSFDLAGPKSPPDHPSMPLEPPGTLWMRIDAPGFDPLELEREIGALRVIDLGDLRLEARTPELVLAPGHGLTPELVAWHGFEIAGQPERYWEVRWGRLADDGALELHFGEEELAAADKAPDWATARAMILHTNDREVPVRAFERDAQDRWVAVEMRRHTLEFQVEPSASARNWWVGWEWNGLFAVCEGFSRPAAGERLEVRLSAPVDGARLGWASREPGRRGWLRPDEIVPLSAATVVHVLR